MNLFNNFLQIGWEILSRAEAVGSFRYTLKPGTTRFQQAGSPPLMSFSRSANRRLHRKILWKDLKKTPRKNNPITKFMHIHLTYPLDRSFHMLG